MNANPASSAATPPSVANAPPSSPGLAKLYVGFTAVATFLGAFLLFQVQPLVAGAILPWFGGTAAVWTTSLLFFQAALVAGYGYVDLTHRLVPPRQRIVFQLLLAAASLLLLPILPQADQRPPAGVEPTLPILLLLGSCVGLPYFVLSTTGPLLQDWFRTRFPDRSPYRLYALSNFGSLCGLLTYPLIIEPAFDFSRQSNLWSVLFVVYAATLAVCGIASWRSAQKQPTPVVVAPAVPAEQQRRRNKPEASETNATPSWRDVGIWIGLAALGNLVLMTTTSYVSVDVAPDPLLWILPLALYLTSFIISFDHPRWYRPGLFAVVLLVALPLAALPSHNALSFLPQTWETWFDAKLPQWQEQSSVVSFVTNASGSFLPSLIANLVMLFAGCMLCHGELARRRPAAQFLTRYYLQIAVGGALGGLFMAVVAPRIYNRPWEWFGTLLGVWLLAAAILAAQLIRVGFLKNGARKISYFAGVVIGLALLARIFTRHFPPDELLSVRNVYGTLTVQAIYAQQTRDLVGFNLRSGSTQHGSQVFTGNNARLPTTYYGVESGVGTLLMQARQRKEPLRVGVVGLGAGTLAVYAQKDDYYRFYEINPAVLELAKHQFSFLGDCRGSQDVVLGDARLSLDAEDAQDFDVLVLDAFSSDAIPKHLLTREAFEVYLRHLKYEGVLAVHISNRYVNLEPLLAAAAREFQLSGATFVTEGAGQIRLGRLQMGAAHARSAHELVAKSFASGPPRYLRTSSGSALDRFAQQHLAASEEMTHYEPILHVVLHSPEIPHNTGSVGRTCVAVGAKLWLVRPLGFRVDDYYLRRAGLDYWERLEWEVVDHWQQLTEKLAGHKFYYFSKTAARGYADIAYNRGDVLVFGCETKGLPRELLDSDPAAALKIPIRSAVRSLNLSNSAAIVIYEAVRQFGLSFDG
ncbi:MAG: fused MFS/spermidine synthase [Pirellulales bacterium]